MKAKFNPDLLNKNIFRALLALAIPMMLNNLLQICYNLTDTYWLGKLGKEAMAAITLVSPLQNVITNLGGGLSGGGAVILSQCFGSGDLKRCAKTANQVFFMIMSFSLFAALILLFLSGAMVKGMGATGEVWRMAVTYQQIMAVDIPLIYMVNVYSSVQNSSGKTAKPLALNFVGIAINMVLDPLFLVVFKWGAAGAALATVFSKIPCAAIAMYLLTRPSNPVRIRPFRIKPDKRVIWDIMKVGLPMGIGNSAMSLGLVLMNKNVMDYGTIAVAAFGIGNKLNGIISAPSLAMGNAVSIFSGQAKGAKRYDKGVHAMFAGMGMMFALMLVAGFILSRNAVARAAIGIFSNDAEVIANGADFLAIMSLMVWSNAVYDASKGYLNGLGKTVSTVTVNAARLWVFRFAVLFVCEHILKIGVASIWYAVTLSNAISAVVMAALALIQARRNIGKRSGVSLAKHSAA